MSKIVDPKRFSEVYGILPALLEGKGAFDPILNADTLLFIDPLLLSASAHSEMHNAYATWREHFEKISKLLAEVQQFDDPVWRAIDRLLSFREFKGTCLGYGSGSIRGTALAADVRHRIIATAQRIVGLGIRDPEFFTVIPLIEEDVGPDSISDMTSHVISQWLAAFTVRVLACVQIPRERFKIGSAEFELPTNPFENDRGKPLPVVLVPVDVLRDLPVAASWSDIDQVVAHNEDLRTRVSAEIGDIWEKKSRKEKDELRRSALSSREAFQTILDIIHALSRDAYDLGRDPAGRHKWLEVGRSIANEFPFPLSLNARDISGLREVVEKIIEHFKYLIENQGVWKFLYIDGKPLNEQFSQKIFFVTADAYCRASGVDITPEANSGTGPVDFKFSNGYDVRAVVELKLSRNTSLRNGYTKQLEAYKKGERTDVGYYVVLDVGDGDKQLDDVLRLEMVARNEQSPRSQVIVIDATPKSSASKR